MKRSAGVLLPLFSLPSPYGIGTMGKAAYSFIDFLAASGQSWWQLLPLGPASCGDSPYSSFSSFAGNPYYIDPDMLIEDGLLLREEVDGFFWGDDASRVDYDALFDSRLKLLRLAYRRAGDSLRGEINEFITANSGWLLDYALFMSIKDKLGMKPWSEWPEDIRFRRPEALESYRTELSDEIDFRVFTQFLFFRQWELLRSYAADRGIGFIGDVPIYVAMDSADVWSEPQFFLLDDELVPKEVAGVPPDAFTDEGQLWGNPLYDWDKMKADGFGWWIRRIEGVRRLYDVIRIDHFRGLASYWAVPYGDKTAERGVWRKGPGMELVRVLTGWFYKLEYIAEDLGCLTPDVFELLSDSGLPGMNVLQFAFDADGESLYLPHNIKINSSCYVGTHDNNTTLGWLESLSDADRNFAKRYARISDDEGWCRGMIRLGMSTPSRLFVSTMQDLLELDGDCRTNIPGVALGNWRWRMLPDADLDGVSKWLKELTELYRR